MARLPWRSVLFDLDGTLVDTIDLIVASHRHAVSTVLGRELPDAMLRGGIGRPLIEQMRVFDPERAQELYDTYRVWNHANTERLLRRYEGVDDVLIRLHAAGAAIGVVTSKSRDAVQLAQRILPPPVPFDAVVTAEDTDRHKPGPEPILHALALLGGTPAEAVYVGDARYDVMAARAAGVAAVAVTWGAGERQELRAAQPDAIAGSPAELAEVLGVGGPEGA